MVVKRVSPNVLFSISRTTAIRTVCFYAAHPICPCTFATFLRFYVSMCIRLEVVQHKHTNERLLLEYNDSLQALDSQVRRNTYIYNGS